MRITNQGLTSITCALDWVDPLVSFGRQAVLAIEDVEINEAKGARLPWSVVLDKLDLVGEGDTFDEAAQAFYEACKERACQS